MAQSVAEKKSVKKTESGVVSKLKIAKGRRWDHLELLERIDATGSITAAASAMGMSYKAAWEAVEAINNLSEQPLVERKTGGSKGGGTTLTVYGRRVAGAYRRLEQEREQVLKKLAAVMDDFDEYYHLIRRFDMKTSARNQFLGTVKSIKLGAINAEVVLEIGGGDMLAAVITNESVNHLGLKIGSEAYALIKAPWVIVTTSDGFKTSARNELHGTVVRCQEGAVNGEVIIELSGGKSVAAIVTNDSIKSLGLKEGVKAAALIKASHVILAVNA
ncbi:MAG: TOBE domain-containing protein [Gammaproteobacteria bacterium]|nr:TOBE domain-containing protein [Gammaproteobacteria bacterium]MBU1482884.1 TOBE domain-containing protein [Gammaproteobacteria bacterium]